MFKVMRIRWYLGQVSAKIAGTEWSYKRYGSAFGKPINTMFAELGRLEELHTNAWFAWENNVSHEDFAQLCIFAVDLEMPMHEVAAIMARTARDLAA